MIESCFVTGTDTGVGKTRVALELVRRAVAGGARVGAMKPVAAGWIAGQPHRNDDAVALQAAANVPLRYELVNPVCLERPTSPHLAARAERIAVDLEPIKSAFEAIRVDCDVIIAEGAGGWFAPIAEGRSLPGTQQPDLIAGTMQDVALALGLPVLLVVGVRLGCLSHALLTAAAIRTSGLPLNGWCANLIDPHFADAAGYIESLTARLAGPPLLTLPYAP